MAVSLAATFTLLDNASPKLDSIALKARAADKALRSMGGTTSGMDMARQPTAAAKAMDILTGKVDEAAKATKNLGNETDAASAKLTKHRTVLGTVTSAFTSLGRGISSVFGWFKQLPKSIDDSTKSFVANHSAIKNVSGSVAGLAVGLKNVIAPFGLMSAGILAATSAATPLVGVLGELLGNLTSMVGGGAAIGGGVLGSFAVGIGSVVAVAKPAITQLTDYRTAVKNLQTAEESGSASAVKTAQSRLDAISKQNQGVAQLSQGLTGFEDAWKKATASGRTQFFDLANTAISDMRKNLSYLGPLADANTKAVNTAFQRNLGPLLTGKTFQDFATRLSTIFQKNIGPFTHGITNIFKGLDNILRDLQPQMEGVGSWFDKLTKRFEDWTTHTKTIQQMGADFRNWGRILGDVAKILASILGAGAKEGSSMVGKWADSMDKFTAMVTGPKGQKGIQSFFSQASDQMNKLWPTLKDVATTLLHIYQAWRPLGGVYLKVLDAVAKVTSDIPTPLLTGALAAIIGGKAVAGATGAFSKVTGGIGRWAGPGAGKGAAVGAEEAAEKGVGKRLLGKAAAAFSQQGETPLKPLYVMVVNEGFGTGVGAGGGPSLGGAAKEEEAAASKGGFFSRLRSRVGGLFKRGGAATVAEEALPAAATTAGGAGLLGRARGLLSTVGERSKGLLSTLSARTGIGAPGGAVAGEETKGLLSRLIRGGGWHGIGGATGGATGMAAMMAVPMLAQMLPAGVQRAVGGVLNTGIGRRATNIATGFLSGGVGGAGVQALNAVLPSSITRTGAARGLTQAAMMATTGATIGSIVPGVGTLAGAGIGAAIGGAQALGWNPMTAAGRKKFISDMGKTWDTVKKGAGAAWKGISGAAGDAVGFVKKHWEIAGAIAGPVGLGVIEGIKHFGQIKTFVKGLPGEVSKGLHSIGGFLSKGFSDAWGFIKGVPGKIIKAFEDSPIVKTLEAPFKGLLSFVGGLPGKIGSVFKSVGHAAMSGIQAGVHAVGGAAHAVGRAVGTVGHAVGGAVSTATGAVGGAAHAVGSFFGLARGGRVPHASTVLVGEAGPELLQLPGGARVTPLTGPYAPWPEYGMQTGVAQPLATPGPVRAGLNIVGQIFSGELNAQGIARLANGVRALSNALTGRDSLESALDDVGDQFDDTSKRARNDWQDMISATKDATDKIGKDLTDANDALTKNYNQLVKSITTAMNSGVLATQTGVDKVFSLMAKAFSTLGVSSPVAKRVQKASGGAKKTARGGRLPGPAIGDHIPLFDKGGNLLGIADGGELVVNRHTESRVNAKLAAFGTTLGREVAGERTPHAKYERGGRVPRFATGGVVGQVDQFFSAHGFDKIAIAGILGNAMQESGLNPNTPGGGMWQQISNFGQGTGGSLLAQMQRMLPQIEGLRNALNRASSPGQAAQIFEQGFEKAGIPAMANRIRYAQEAYAGKLGGALSGAAGGSVPTVAKIKAPKVTAAGLLPGEIATLAQRGVTAVTTAVNNVLQSAAGRAMGAGGGAGAAPMAGPAAVKAMIRKADEIASHNYYYEWGGGHNGSFAPSHGTGHGSGPGVGYDCSGSVSAVLHAAGLLNAPQTAGFFESFGSPGPGKHVTIWAAPWHTFMRINGHYFGTSGQNFGGGANWMPHFPENLVTVRHPTGLARGGRISRRGDSPVAHPKTSKLTEQQFADMTAVEQQRHRRNQGAIMRGMALGGRIPWFADGADFIAKRPQLIGVGDAPGGERVTVTPQRQNPTTTRPVHVEIHNIQVNRKGDVQKIVDEEMRLLAASLGGG